MKKMKIWATAMGVAALTPFLTAQVGAEDASAPQEVLPEQQQAVPAGDVAAAPAEVVLPEEAPVPAADGERRIKVNKDQKKQMGVRLIYARKARIDAEIALEKARLSEHLARGNAERVRLESETALQAARNADKCAEAEFAKRRLDAVSARDRARGNLALVERQNRLDEAELTAKIAKLEQDLVSTRYSRDLSQVKMAEALRNVVVSPEETVQYRKEPLENGTLYISDRRIEFNGVVTNELADYVVRRIYFYNNQSTEYPIFIVIDSSPGGSVAAGYEIVKAMESSKAPVYVVVKSYAASMAAMITTLAQRSFCFEKTIILHHQPSTETNGNLTQIRESLQEAEAWTRILNDKIAAKMGLNYPDYVREMYAHNSRGDWSEFGSEALRLNWVTDVVDFVSETGIVRVSDKPAGTPKENRGNARACKFDEKGQPYFELPSLPAGDFWMIYDPNHLYRPAGL